MRQLCPTHRLPPPGYAATDSRRHRPNTVCGSFEIVTTECRRPDGAGACDSVARNSASLGVGPEPSPPRSDSRRTWLAVMPSVTCCVGSECLRVSRASRHGDSRYGLTGESMSSDSRGVDLRLACLLAGPLRSVPDSSTTITGSPTLAVAWKWWASGVAVVVAVVPELAVTAVLVAADEPRPNEGVNEERRSRLKCSGCWGAE